MIDYAEEDFTKNGKKYDVVFDAVGKLSFMYCRGSLEPDGVYLPTDGWLNIALVLWPARLGAKRVASSIPPHYTQKDVVFLKELIEAGSTARSSAGRIRWRTWSRPRSTSRRGRRPGTSC